MKKIIYTIIILTLISTVTATDLENYPKIMDGGRLIIDENATGQLVIEGIDIATDFESEDSMLTSEVKKIDNYIILAKKDNNLMQKFLSVCVHETDLEKKAMIKYCIVNNKNIILVTGPTEELTIVAADILGEHSDNDLKGNEMEITSDVISPVNRDNAKEYTISASSFFATETTPKEKSTEEKKEVEKEAGKNETEEPKPKLISETVEQKTEEQKPELISETVEQKTEENKNIVEVKKSNSFFSKIINWVIDWFN